MDAISTKRLDYLPIVGQALRRLGVRELIDGLVPLDPRSNVSTGECVEALIVAILHGKHTLYRIDELLAVYDLELAFGWTGSDEDFHDDRLGRALTDTFDAGLMKLQTAAIVRAVKAHELDLRHLHLDTSSVAGQQTFDSEPSPNLTVDRPVVGGTRRERTAFGAPQGVVDVTV